MEQWKNIFDNYEISSNGRIRNGVCFLRPTVDKTTGYEVVNLYKNGMPKKNYIHRLVAEAFIPNPQHKRTINHIDTNKTNNVVENLEWATDSENMKHAFSHGLCDRTIESAKNQQKVLAKMPRTQKQKDSARTVLTETNKRPKTKKQLECASAAISSDACKKAAKISHQNRHPKIMVVETGDIWESQRDLAISLGINETAICAVLHGRRNQAGGYHFVYI